MPDARLTVTIHGEGNAEDVEFHTSNMATALVIADINAGMGRADIRRGGRVLARLTKRSGDHAPFWQVE